VFFVSSWLNLFLSDALQSDNKQRSLIFIEIT